MSLQSAYDALKPLSDQGRLTLRAVSSQIPQVSTLGTSLPAFSSMTFSKSALAISGSGPRQQLAIDAQVSWGLFTGACARIVVTSDPTRRRSFIARFSCDIGDRSGLAIPDVPWFSLSQVAVAAWNNPYGPVSSGLENAVDVAIEATLTIAADSSRTPIPIKLATGSGGEISTTLDTASVKFPGLSGMLAAFGDHAGGINLPPGLDEIPTFSLLRLEIGFIPPTTVSRIGLAFGHTATSKVGWSILPGIFTVDQYAVSLTVVDPLAAAGREIGGSIEAKVFLGTVGLSVAAIHPAAGGWQFGGYLGKESAVPIGDLIAGLASRFGVDLPAALNEFTLDDLEFGFDTQTTAARAKLGVRFAIGGTAIGVTIDAAFAKTSGKYLVDVGGKITVGPADFTVAFVDNASKTFFARWRDDARPLDFHEVAGTFGWSDMPSVPSSLDLRLTQASLLYDFTAGSLIFAGQSKTYGAVCFAAIVIAGSHQFFFQIDIDRRFSLSDLPLVGKELAAIENIELKQLEILACSMAPSAATVATINQLIGRLNESAGTDFPSLPPGGATGAFLLRAQIAFGGDATPLSLPLDGGGDAPRRREAAPAGTPDGQTSAISWFPVQKSYGPVSIERIGAMYQSDRQTLWFEIDASLNFGPLALGLDGLGVSSPFSSFSPRFGLEGISVSYMEPPLEISGSLVDLAPPGADYFAFEGGLTISTGDFTITAFGYYGNGSRDLAGHRFPSMFVFGDIAYDFGGPPALFVTGLALGFGYNSSLTIPTIVEIATFPFVEVLPTSALPNTNLFGGGNATPLTVLDTITTSTPAWVAPEKGTLWFAAGVTFTSFELLNSQALVMIEAGQDLVVAIIGTSRAQFPQPVPGIPDMPTYAFIELDLEAVFAPLDGVFSVQAQLASSSFLLDRACVLEGGFAFFAWFGANPHAGDFVLSLGGYNPGFTAPAHYPAVPRVGFHWSLDASISIQGGAYFALTPSVLMFGGLLEATYQAGNLRAWFDASADVVIDWKPFWFDAEIGITVGASYKVDLLFSSATFSVELGCKLELWGPPTGGTVTVDWYVLSFTIPFGEQSKTPPPAQAWKDVEGMLPSNGAQDARPISISPAAGLYQPASSPSKKSQQALSTAGSPAKAPSPQPAPWTVRGAGFAFRTNAALPATRALFGVEGVFQGSKFSVRPLAEADAAWAGVSATHVVRISTLAAPDTDVCDRFVAVPLLESVPASLWGAPHGGGGPKVPGAGQQLVANQIVGFEIVAAPARAGGSPGRVDTATCLAHDALSDEGELPLAASAVPSGDTPTACATTISVIADPVGGIAGTKTIASRASVLSALASLSYAPATRDDAMTAFSAEAGRMFAAVPMLAVGEGA